MKLTEFNIMINKEQVLDFIDCKPDSPLYESTMEELEKILPEAYEKIKPVALLGFGNLQGVSPEYEDESPEVIFAVVTVGDEISRWSTSLFEKNNYLLGMLVDAIADNYLFQMDEAVISAIRDICREKKMGVAARLEAPQDIPVTAHKKSLEATDAAVQAGIQLVESSYMFDPVKTICQIYVLTDDAGCMNIDHNCSTCQNRTCKLRSVSEYKLTVVDGSTEKTINQRDNKTILEGLNDNNIHLTAICAGRGTCGKCRIRLVDGNIPITEKDREFFDENALEKGYRLACRDYINTDCTIDISESVEAEFEAVTEFDRGEHGLKGGSDANTDTYAIACDIGTTTIAAQLFSLESGDIVKTFTTINRQRAYGGDVISRIDASNSGRKDELRNSIREDINLCVNQVTGGGNIKVERMTVTANTTMIHLLMGYSCEGLGVYPFVPVNIDTVKLTYGELMGNDQGGFSVTILPGISAFVGGDIVSGLYSLEFNKRDKVSVLVDLGTNGEIAVGNKDKILVASTAAGPAFEGGNIIYGMGSVPGAICGVSISEGEVCCETIGKKEPVGICGTGVIDTVYELLKEELIDETGMLDEKYKEQGFNLTADKNGHNISFHLKDIREIQLVKSAIRAGLEVLLLRYGITYNDIDQIFIAGGFGYKIDIKKAVGIGLFPEELEGKITAVGNTSLKGAYLYSLNEGTSQNAVREICESAEEINLAEDEDFNKLYMDYMYFRNS